MAKQANALEEKIAPILHGKDPGVQGATLASLVACWLAGFSAGTREDTADLRERLADAHLRSAMELVPLYEALIATRNSRRQRRAKAH